MPRANRCYIEGHIWHITHRCHRRRFHLRFARDRRSWVRWLYAARARFGLCVLDYCVTSNHVHLLARDRGFDEIPKSLQLIAGCTGQAFNARKDHHGGFWEDRYHATAVDSGQHLARCLVYIDLNMVRAGMVRHPSEWEGGGYHEIQCPPQRYRIIDRHSLAQALDIDNVDRLAALHREWVDTALQTRVAVERADYWTESMAVGGPSFVKGVQAKLGTRGSGRRIDSVSLSDGLFALREPDALYSFILEAESESLRQF